jgi:hypothetical protein
MNSRLVFDEYWVKHSKALAVKLVEQFTIMQAHWELKHCAETIIYELDHIEELCDREQEKMMNHLLEHSIRLCLMFEWAFDSMYVTPARREAKTKLHQQAKELFSQVATMVYTGL